jgi:hypothetical protein
VGMTALLREYCVRPVWRHPANCLGKKRKLLAVRRTDVTRKVIAQNVKSERVIQRLCPPVAMSSGCGAVSTLALGRSRVQISAQTSALLSEGFSWFSEVQRDKY